MADASTLPVELELPEDDILDRSQPYRLVPEHDPPAAGQAPGVKGVIAGKIDIGAEPGFVMSEIEMANRRPRRSRFAPLDRRTVDRGGGKASSKMGARSRIQLEDQIQVLGI